MANIKVKEQVELLGKIADEIVIDDEPVEVESVANALLSAAFRAECLARGIVTDDVYIDRVVIDPTIGLIANVIAPASLRADADAAYDAARIRLDDALETLGKWE